MRNYLHYPAVISKLGKIHHKKILDVGCGDGALEKILTRDFGAKVIGYDKSPELITKAKNEELVNNFGIEYFVADQESFISDGRFDDAVSVMVLPYSTDINAFNQFFSSTYSNLKDSGRFVAVTTNPLFTKFGATIGNRIFNKKDNKIEVNFLNPENGTLQFTAVLTQFTKEEYEQAATKAGFKEFAWDKLYPNAEGKKLLGDEFWKVCEEEQPYTVFTATK
jgi:cyclopropane fatty-acyl-phospholipid synthase-like methyltransferase